MPKALQSTAAFAAKLQAYLTQIVSMSHTTNVDTVSERGRACHPPRIRHQSATAVLRGNKPVPNFEVRHRAGCVQGALPTLGQTAGRTCNRTEHPQQHYKWACGQPGISILMRHGEALQISQYYQVDDSLP